MLAGCPALHSYQAQCAQPRVHVSYVSPPSSPSPLPRTGLIDHPLFQTPLQNCILDRSYEYFVGDAQPLKSSQSNALADMIAKQERSSFQVDELACNFIHPSFSTAERREGASARSPKNQSSASSRSESSEDQMAVVSGLRANPSARSGIVWEQPVIVEAPPKREFPNSWNDAGAAEHTAEPPHLVTVLPPDLAPWLLADAAPSDGVPLPPAEYAQSLQYSAEYRLLQHAQECASTSTTQYGPDDVVTLRGGAAAAAGREAATASLRGSCSPSASMALSGAGSPSSSVPSSNSTVMLSPPLSSNSAMVQQDSTGGALLGHTSPFRCLIMAASSASPAEKGNLNESVLPKSARELCYGDFSVTNPMPLSCFTMPSSIFSANLGVPSLVQQQYLSEEDREQSSTTELVDLLVACVEAISAGSLTFITHLLARLGKLASPAGTSMHRLAAYFTEGLGCRVSKMWPHIYQPLLPFMDSSDELQDLAMKSCEGQDALGAWQVLNHVTPLIKFSHFTANEMILQAFEGEERVHVIDLDIKQGLQWPALFQCLAKRKGGPPQNVRVTGIGECSEEVQDAGDRLAEFAEELGLKLEFHAVVDKLEDVRLWMLHVKAEPREAVAVNCILQLQKALHDESGAAMRNLLSLIHSTRPKVVAMVEQEVDLHDQPSLEARFSIALRYFAALFDAVDAALPRCSPARAQLESHFAAQIRNILACDGPQRKERYQLLRRWQRLLKPAGFCCLPISQRARLQAEILLRMFSSLASYGILPPSSASEPRCLTLAWLDHPLFTASAWTPSP